jgi:magnesium transporter
MKESEKNIKNEHPIESAGHLMVRTVPIVKTKDTIDEIKKKIIKEIDSFESISYIYVLDSRNVLKGVLSIKELFRASKIESAENVMIKKIATVRAHTDQERVALFALRYNIKAVPVINKEGVFLGVVPTDTILNVLHTESVEDALRMAGAGKFKNPDIQIITASTWFHFKKRIPWLLFGLIGGIGAAFVVRYFEDALESHIILAAFIPAVVYMADAVGSQTQTIFIRSLALTRTLDTFKYIIREIKVSCMLALTLGSVAFAFVSFWINSFAIGIVFGMSIIVTIMAAMAIALIVPWILVKMHYDPAIASGPFATVMRDISSLLIYFAIASSLF